VASETEDEFVVIEKTTYLEEETMERNQGSFCSFLKWGETGFTWYFGH
jgi:hypothetical protein